MFANSLNSVTLVLCMSKLVQVRSSLREHCQSDRWFLINLSTVVFVGVAEGFGSRARFDKLPVQFASLVKCLSFMLCPTLTHVENLTNG